MKDEELHNACMRMYSTSCTSISCLDSCDIFKELVKVEKETRIGRVDVE